MRTLRESSARDWDRVIIHIIAPGYKSLEVFDETLFIISSQLSSF